MLLKVALRPPLLPPRAQPHPSDRLLITGRPPSLITWTLMLVRSHPIWKRCSIWSFGAPSGAHILPRPPWGRGGRRELPPLLHRWHQWARSTKLRQLHRDDIRRARFPSAACLAALRRWADHQPILLHAEADRGRGWGSACRWGFSAAGHHSGLGGPWPGGQGDSCRPPGTQAAQFWDILLDHHRNTSFSLIRAWRQAAWFGLCGERVCFCKGQRRIGWWV